MAKQKSTPRAARSWLWLQGALSGGLLVLAPGTALVVVTLLGVAIATFLFEQTPGRPVARSMLLMGGAASLSSLIHLWQQGGSLDVAAEMLADPVVPLWCWAASGSAWLIGQIWEVLAVFGMRKTDEVAEKSLKDERTRLMEEWRNVA